VLKWSSTDLFQLMYMALKIHINERQCLEHYQSDICCIQESYINKSDALQWKCEWGGELLYVEGTSHSKGQVILLSKKCAQSKHSVLYQSERILAMSISIEQHTIVIINVYGPSVQKDKHTFLLELSDVCNNYVSDADNIYVVGDFNMVMNNAKDILAGEKHNTGEVKLFNDTIDNLQLNDVWRMFHPDDNQYTWHRTNPFIARRLDYIFASDSALTNVHGCGTLTVPSSDHKGVYCDIQFSSYVKGPSYWKFNNSQLHDKTYIDGMNSLIDEICIEDSREPQEKWEFCKVKMRDFSINYGKSKAMDNRNKATQVREKLEEAEKQLCEHPHDAVLQNKVSQLLLQFDLHSIHEAKGAQTRARVKWIEEGERNNKYFLSLEKTKAINNTITSLVDSNGDIVTDQSKVRDAQYNYYKKLYSKKVVYANQQDNMAQFLSSMDIPQLSEEQKQSCEGEIDIEEAGYALSDINNGSAPGVMD
jgi:exonuclease III